MDLFGRFQSSWSRQQRFGSQESAAVAPSTQTPFTNQQWQFDQEASRLCQLAWDHGRSKRPLEHRQMFLGMSVKSQQMMTSEEDKVNQCHSVLHEDQCQQSPVKTGKEWQDLGGWVADASCCSGDPEHKPLPLPDRTPERENYSGKSRETVPDKACRSWRKI